MEGLAWDLGDDGGLTMSIHTQPDIRSGYPTFGGPRVQTGATSGRWGTTKNPSTGAVELLDDAGNPVITSTASVATLSVGGTAKARLSSTTGLSETVKLAVAGTSSSSGVIASVLNPFGTNVIITRALLVVSTQSTGAATVDIGTAADATTSNDGLIDGKSVASAGTFDNLVAADAGTNGKTFRAWGSTQYLNVAEASGDVDGLVATLYVTVLRT